MDDFTRRHGIGCEKCGAWLPKNRMCFPWGSSKPKICIDCINDTFAMLMLSVSFADTVREVESELHI